MRISKVRVQNLRAIVNTELSLGGLTALIGANNAGKTTFLLALERFFDDKPKRMEIKDFHNMKCPISITVTFEGVDGKNEIEICREWKCTKTSTTASYTPEKVNDMDCKDFLKKYVNVIYVPAEHETDDDAEDKKNTPLEQIINDAIRRIVENDKDAKKQQEILQGRYQPKLSEVKAALDGKLRGENGGGYAPNVEVSLEFKKTDVTLKTDLSIIDGISKNSIDHKYMGHGTKRAFYMAALEVVGEMARKAGKDGGKKAPEAGAEAPKGTGEDRGMLTLIIIDEPELHQHPQRQRLLLKALQNLADTSSQVVYTTHSPMMITLNDPMDIRKVVNSGSGVVVHEWNGPKGKPVGGKMIKVMEEAVFASGAILVEGYVDETIINAILCETRHEEEKNINTSDREEAAAASCEVKDIEREERRIMDTLVRREVVVVNCEGKESMMGFYDVLKSLGTEQFVVWDGDLDKAYKKPDKKKVHSPAEKLERIRDGNKRIVGNIGIGQEFLGELETTKNTYAEDSGCVCFGWDGPAYWAEYFDCSKKKLVKIIKEGEHINPKFDSAKFKNSDFYKTVLNIRKHFVASESRLS